MRRQRAAQHSALPVHAVCTDLGPQLLELGARRAQLRLELREPLARILGLHAPTKGPFRFDEQGIDKNDGSKRVGDRPPLPRRWAVSAPTQCPLRPQAQLRVGSRAQSRSWDQAPPGARRASQGRICWHRTLGHLAPLVGLLLGLSQLFLELVHLFLGRGQLVLQLLLLGAMLFPQLRERFLPKKGTPHQKIHPPRQHQSTGFGRVASPFSTLVSIAFLQHQSTGVGRVASPSSALVSVAFLQHQSTGVCRVAGPSSTPFSIACLPALARTCISSRRCSLDSSTLSSSSVSVVICCWSRAADRTAQCSTVCDSAFR